LPTLLSQDLRILSKHNDSSLAFVTDQEAGPRFALSDNSLPLPPFKVKIKRSLSKELRSISKESVTIAVSKYDCDNLNLAANLKDSRVPSTNRRSDRGNLALAPAIEHRGKERQSWAWPTMTNMSNLG